MLKHPRGSALGPAELLFNCLKTVVKWIFGFYILQELFGHQIEQVHEQLPLGFPTVRGSTQQAPLHPGVFGLHRGKTQGVWLVKASLKFMTHQFLYFLYLLLILSSQRPQRGFAGPILSWSLWCIFISKLGGNNSSWSMRKLWKLPSAQQLPQNSAFKQTSPMKQDYGWWLTVKRLSRSPRKWSLKSWEHPTAARENEHIQLWCVLMQDQ